MDQAADSAGAGRQAVETLRARTHFRGGCALLRTGAARAVHESKGSER